MTVHVRQLEIASETDDSARVHVDRLISIDDRAKSVVARCTRACTHPQRAPSGVTEQRERKELRGAHSPEAVQDAVRVPQQGLWSQRRRRGPGRCRTTNRNSATVQRFSRSRIAASCRLTCPTEIGRELAPKPGSPHRCIRPRRQPAAPLRRTPVPAAARLPDQSLALPHLRGTLHRL